MNKVDTTLWVRDEQVINKIIEAAGTAYKKGDWHTLNEKFAAEFAKEGIGKEATKRLLMRFQKAVFAELELTSDTFAEADGKLGLYTMYAFALYYNLKRPKVKIPYRSPQLEALVNDDASKAYKAYKRFDFAKGVNELAFKDVYRNIKINVSRFNPDPEFGTLGKWAIALWESGYRGDKARKIGFPKMIDYRKSAGKYPYVRAQYDKDMILVIEREDMELIFVDKKGKMFVRYKADSIKPFHAPLAVGEPFKEEEKKAPTPKPKKSPAPAPKEEAPEEKLEDDSKLVAEAKKPPTTGNPSIREDMS